MRAGLGVAVLIGFALATLDLALGTALLGAGDLARFATLLGGVRGPGRLAAAVGQAAITGGAVAGLGALAVGVAAGLAVAAMTRRWGRVTFALACVPGLVAASLWAISAILLVAGWGPVVAILAGFEVAAAAGARAVLVALLAPIVAATVARAAGRLDADALAELSTLGLTPLELVWRVWLPELLPSAIGAGSLAFLAAAAWLFVRAVPSRPRLDAVTAAAATLDTAAVGAAAFCLAAALAVTLAIRR